MSAATALALVDVLVRLHHWHKTEHGPRFTADAAVAR
jgi:hypothetical protein